jgi:hypothetical protein
MRLSDLAQIFLMLEGITGGASGNSVLPRDITFRLCWERFSFPERVKNTVAKP